MRGGARRSESRDEPEARKFIFGIIRSRVVENGAMALSKAAKSSFKSNTHAYSRKHTPDGHTGRKRRAALRAVVQKRVFVHRARRPNRAEYPPSPPPPGPSRYFLPHRDAPVWLGSAILRVERERVWRSGEKRRPTSRRASAGSLAHTYSSVALNLSVIGSSLSRFFPPF